MKTAEPQPTPMPLPLQGTTSPAALQNGAGLAFLIQNNPMPSEAFSAILRANQALLSPHHHRTPPQTPDQAVGHEASPFEAAPVAEADSRVAPSLPPSEEEHPEAEAFIPAELPAPVVLLDTPLPLPLPQGEVMPSSADTPERAVPVEMPSAADARGLFMTVLGNAPHLPDPAPLPPETTSEVGSLPVPAEAPLPEAPRPVAPLPFAENASPAASPLLQEAVVKIPATVLAQLEPLPAEMQAAIPLASLTEAVEEGHVTLTAQATGAPASEPVTPSETLPDSLLLPVSAPSQEATTPDSAPPATPSTLPLAKETAAQKAQHAVESSEPVDEGSTAPEDPAPPQDPTPSQPAHASLEEVPLKPQAPYYAALPLQNPAEQIKVELVRAAGDQNVTLKVALHPAELGSVDVTLEKMADGKVNVILAVEKLETLLLLQKDTKFLEHALRDLGYGEEGALNLSLNQQQQQERSPRETFPYATVLADNENVDPALSGMREFLYQLDIRV